MEFVVGQTETGAVSAAAFGTPKWKTHVRETPPVRDPRGRSRPTHRFSPYCEALQRNVGIEGGNELTCFLLLEILHAAGLIRWFKEQPFALTKEQHGIEATPDFIFEWMDGRLYVPEVKSAKFVTSDVEDKTAQLAAFMAKEDITYVLWTDKKHLHKRLWHNVRAVRRAGIGFFSPADVERVRATVRDGPKTLQQLIDGGVDSDLVLNQIRAGAMHFNLLEKRNAKTIITPCAEPALYADLLSSRPDPESWWNALPDHRP